MLVRYSWLLFDADGTLFDYDLAERKAISATFEELGLPFPEDTIETYRQINGRLWREFEAGMITIPVLTVQRFSELFDALGIQGANPAEFEDRYLVALGRCADLVDGAQEVVEVLARHFRLALIMISEEVGLSKPHPGYFDAAFENIGRPPREEVLIIGDSLTSDIQGGNNYGVDVCWYNPSGKIADPKYRIQHEITDLRQLLPLLGVG
jgi:2-haloacid dehalogenase